MLAIFTSLALMAPLPAAAQDAAATPPNCTPDIAEQSVADAIACVFILRQNGIEFYGPYLEEFAQLWPEQQYLVARAIYAPDAEGDMQAVIQNLRLPEGMIAAVLEETKANGADGEWDIPAFQEALEELRLQGNTGAKTLADMVEKAPNSAGRIYVIVASQAVQRRLVDAQGRLVDLEGRLVDAQERLLDLEYIRTQQDEILGN